MPDYTQGEASVVFPEGDYDFVCVDAGEKESQSHKVMIELELSCTDGREQTTVIDQLVFVKSAFWKIDDFRRATGEELTPGQKVSFEAEDCIDRKGRCHLVVDVYNGRSKNKVGGYNVPVASPAAAQPVQPKFAENQIGSVGAVPASNRPF
jgi:hypothetical protein